MRRKMFLFIMTLLMLLHLTTLTYARQNIYSFLANIYRNDTVVLLEFNVAFDEPVKFPAIDVGYKLKIIDHRNNSIFEAFLPIEFKQHVTTTEGPKDIYLEMTPLYLKIPYFESASRIEIYHEDRLIFTHNICNFDNICEPEKGENTINCPNDCLAITTTTLPPTEPTFQFYYFLIIFVLIAVVLIFLLTRIKVQKSESSN